MVKEKTKAERNYQLDFYKLLFALCVFIYHSRILAPEGHYVRQISNKWGFMCVHFFFLVSGMLMVNSIIKKQPTDNEGCAQESGMYVLRKFSSIAIPYYTAFFLSFIARMVIEVKGNGLPLVHTICVTLIKSIPELLCIQNAGVAPVAINDPTWYISAMLLAMLPLNYILRRNSNFYIYVLSPLAAILLLGYFYESGHPTFPHIGMTGPVSSGILRAICGICFGSISYIIAEFLKKNIRTKEHRLLLTIAEILISAIFLIIWVRKTYNSQYWYPALIIMPVFVGIVFSEKSYICNIFRSKIFRYCGSWSLTIYLNHFAAYRLLQRLPDLEKHTYKEKFLLMILFTAMSCILYVIIIKIVKLSINKITKKTAVGN